MMLPDQILNAAEALPDDDKRREVAAHLRHEAQHNPQLEPDERQVASKCADMIDAMCTTAAPPVAKTAPPSAAPRVHHTPWRPRTTEEFLADYRLELDSAGIFNALGEGIATLPADEAKRYLAQLQEEFQRTPGKSPRQEAILAELEQMIELLDTRPPRRGVDPNSIPDNPAAAPARSPTGFASEKLDHRKAGKKERAAAAKLVRLVDPSAIAIPRPRGPRPADVPQPKPAFPFEVEEKPLDPWKEPPLSPDEIAAREAAKLRHARREIEDALQARRDHRAKRGLPPLSAEQEAKALRREAAPGVEHEDDPEF
jgi:hypothetical protein